MIPSLVLEAQNLQITFGKNILLELPHFHLNAGEIHGVIGESGSGKSLFLLTTIGLLGKGLEASGNLYFQSEGQGYNLLEKKDVFEHLRGKKIGMVFQEPMTSLNPRMKCGAQVLEVVELHTSLNKTKAKELVLRALEETGLDPAGRIYDSYPHQISGGQRQRVMIAMATILKPDLVLADEPTTALDPETGNEVLQTLVERCRKLKSSLILVSHDLKSIAKFADKITVLRNGNCLAQGSTDALLQDQKQEYVQALLDAGKMEHRQRKNGPPVLTISNLAKGYMLKGKKLQVLQQVSVEVGAGETLAIVGKSGSGKSTLAKILTGLEAKDYGEIRFQGKDISALKTGVVQMVFQDPYSSLNGEIRCGQAVQEVMLVKGMAKEAAKARTQELFDLVGLSAEFMLRYPHQISGGQRQRVCIARALASDPLILILDEAVAALDPLVQKQVLQLLQDIQDRTGIIYLFITHDHNIAKNFAHNYVEIQSGIAVQSAVI